MTHEQLRAKMNEVLGLLREEQRLRVEITALDLGPNRAGTLEKNLARHDAILAEINDLRQRRLLPIFRELAHFIKAAHDLEQARAAHAQAAASRRS